MAVSLAKPVNLEKRKVLTPVYTVRVPADFFKRKDK
jgi:hypothetical protein